MLEGLAAIIILLRLPGDVETQRLFGVSTARLALVLVMLALAAGFGLLALVFLRQPCWLRRLRVNRSVMNSLFVGLIFLALLCALIYNLLNDLYRSSGTFFYFALFERLAPLLLWLLLAALQFWVILALKGPFDWHSLRWQQRVYRAASIGLLLVAVLVLFMIITGLGLRVDRIGWGSPTIPLLEWHLPLAGVLAVAALVFVLRHGWRARWNWILPLCIWLVTCAAWLSAPQVPSYFATAGRAPNFEIYPFSDGAYYAHFAQSLLIGNGMQGQQVPPRPLYVALLALFHALAGQQYEAVINVQTFLLACLPVLLYLLGKELHSPAAGLGAALLAVLRELTAIYAAPFSNNFSNSQLFFADLPAALAICGWVLLAVRWLKTDPAGPVFARRAFLAGAALGVAMLVRTQALFILPPVLLLALLQNRSRWRVLLPALLALALGLTITVGPWIVRNRLVTGAWVIDHPDSQSGGMASRYQSTPVTAPPVRLPGEGDAAYQARMQASISEFIRENPGEVLRFVTAHFLNAQAANLQVLPVRAGLTSPRELLQPTWAFWQFWKGQLTGGQATILTVYVIFVVMGVAAAWTRFGWAGFTPLAAQMAYHFSHALARNSGSRYLLPVDWVMYFYALMGALEFVISLMLLFGVDSSRLATVFTRARVPAGLPLRRVALAGLAFALVGSLPAWVEFLFPPRYADPSPARMLGLAAQVLDEAQMAELQMFDDQPGAVLFHGRALYPRFYAAGQGEPATAKTGYEPLPFARTVLLVTSPNYNGLVILRGQQPPLLPHAADVLVAGCLVENHLEAALILVEGVPGSGGSSDLLGRGCR